MFRQVSLTDSTQCELADLVQELKRGDETEFLLELAARDAVLESEYNDGALYHRMAVVALATAWVEAAEGPLLADAARRPLEELFRMANGLPDRRGTVQLTGRALREHNCRVMMRLFALHDTYIGQIAPALGRTDILLGRLLPALLADRSNPLDALPAAMGLSFREARAISFGLYVQALANPGRPVVGAEAFRETIDASRFESAALRLARTRGELFKLKSEGRAYSYSDPADFKYTFSVLRDHPFVKTAAGLIAPVSRHLALGFSDGIYDFLSQHLGDSRDKRAFDTLFGEVTEAYVRERFERELGAESYRSLPRLKQELSPDGHSADGECVFELKGKRLPRGIIATGRLFDPQRFLKGKHGLGRGVAQMLAEIKRTRNGRGRGLNSLRIDDVVPCLVTPDGLPGFHLAPIRDWVTGAFESVVRAEFPEVVSELAVLERFEWLSFDELDALVRAAHVGGSSVGRLLRRFRLEASPTWGDIPNQTLGETLAGWLEAKYNLPPDPWLREAYDHAVEECTQYLFGPP